MDPSADHLDLSTNIWNIINSYAVTLSFVKNDGLVRTVMYVLTDGLGETVTPALMDGSLQPVIRSVMDSAAVTVVTVKVVSRMEDGKEHSGVRSPQLF